MRLIDVDSLVANLNTRAFKDEDDRAIALNVIVNTPTADCGTAKDEEIAKLKADLHEAIYASERNAHLVDEERLRHELYRKDGEIAGLRFAIMCNGVSGDSIYEINRR